MYCRSCYKKVQEGEIAPATNPPKQVSKSKVAESAQVLASMGVEFREETGSTSKKSDTYKKTTKNSNKKGQKPTKQMKEALKGILDDLKKDEK